MFSIIKGFNLFDISVGVLEYLLNCIYGAVLFKIFGYLNLATSQYLVDSGRNKKRIRTTDLDKGITIEYQVLENGRPF